jgi:error-prone DNA polymerase
MIRRADTVGVFQIESRAQMSMLPRLKPKDLLRPGGGGGHRAARADRGRHGAPVPEGARTAGQKRSDRLRAVALRARRPPPRLQKALERTLGIPIFQEQVMEISMIAAGFSAADADGLRRAMAAWKRKGGMTQCSKSG